MSHPFLRPSLPWKPDFLDQILHPPALRFRRLKTAADLWLLSLTVTAVIDLLVLLPGLSIRLVLLLSFLPGMMPDLLVALRLSAPVKRVRRS